jgi:L,D-transpeptidase catalytic domain
MTVRRALAAAAGLLLGAVAVVELAQSESGAPTAYDGLVAPNLPNPPRLGLQIPDPVPLAPAGTESRWAPVLRAVSVRERPRGDAGIVTRLDTKTPEGTANLVLATGRARDADGEVWIRARLPVLPNGTIGWVPRSALGGYTTVSTRLVVDLDRFTAVLLRDGRQVFRAPIGVGTAAAPTPSGDFYLRVRVDGFDDPFYGPLAFGTSARSEVLTDWPGGGFVGIHGTNRPELIPGRISHGCIRMRNDDILALGRLMEVGTPVTIR